MDPLVVVEGLYKSYRQGFWMRRVEAISGISFKVSPGQIFGFLGPNGAGKTTTIKVLTGLIRPTRGEARLFGQPVNTAAARRRVGFLPENPYVYPYLTPREFVSMCARLSGLGYRQAEARTEKVLDQVGLTYAASRPARKLSKGMLQRTGIAAALVADPELLILDEPMSGLDPVGRKEVRDLILNEREQGRTIFFSTHILSDVEAMCDEVTILRRGRVVVSGQLSDLLSKHGTLSTEVVFVGAQAAMTAYCSEQGLTLQQRAERSVVVVDSDAVLQRLLAAALQHQARIVEVAPRHASLEKLFVDSAVTGSDSARDAS